MRKSIAIRSLALLHQPNVLRLVERHHETFP
jgi:hypothetical protein